jgi:quercetin dioxygenase-like cupin family protein
VRPVLPEHASCRGVSVFTYVDRGAVVSESNGGTPTVYHEGALWYEPAGSVHTMARNASETEPAKLVTFFVAQQGRPLSEPVSR